MTGEHPLRTGVGARRVTFRVDGGAEYVKVSPPRWAHHLVAPQRLRWAAAYVTLPHVLDAGDGPPQAGGAPRADLAVATLSLSWNYGDDWEDVLFDAYGIDPEPERVDFYRRCWNAGDVSSH
ncbi:MAG: hypothetical protein ABWY20_18800 [Mycobacterium sp.]